MTACRTPCSLSEQAKRPRHVLLLIAASTFSRSLAAAGCPLCESYSRIILRVLSLLPGIVRAARWCDGHHFTLMHGAQELQVSTTTVEENAGVSQLVLAGRSVPANIAADLGDGENFRPTQHTSLRGLNRGPLHCPPHSLPRQSHLSNLVAFAAQVPCTEHTRLCCSSQL